MSVRATTVACNLQTYVWSLVNLAHRTVEGFGYLVTRVTGLFDADGSGESEVPRPARPRQLTEVTPDDRDRMAAFAADRIEFARRTGPLTDGEWAIWESGARACYQAEGVPWPSTVVKVPSPIVGGLAPLIAERVACQHRTARSDVSLDSAVRPAVMSAVKSTLGPGEYSEVVAALCEAVRTMLDASPSGRAVPAFESTPIPALGGVILSTVSRKMLRAALSEVFDSVVYSVPNVDRAIHSPLYSAVRSVASAKKWQIPLHGRSSVDQNVLSAYFRDATELELDREMRDFSRAVENAQSAGCWWAFREFVVVCDLPTEVTCETPEFSTRFHNADGPAIRWADGWGIYAWHGVRVPADLIETGWDVKRIMAERNVEVRRCAIERIGWDRFVAAAGFKLLDQAPDPANPGQQLRLYAIPRSVLNRRARVLLCVNATPEPSGTRRKFALTVPTTCRTALAAAWTFDIPEQSYRHLARAT